MNSAQALPPVSLYIHLPWCERKCPYCDFNSHEHDSVPEKAYLEALLRDLGGAVDELQGRALSSLFIGGGTPSLFSTKAIQQLMSAIGDAMPMSTDFEATMEANPGSAEADRFQGYRQAGINRLSLGVQSFNEDALRQLGRVHDGEQARAALDMVREAGFSNFNIDLMHGLPGQTAASAMRDIETALAYSPPHLSWYQLTIEPNTVFYKHRPQLPVEDTLADIQEQGEQRLAEAGLAQYEVSAYAAPDRQCRHNLNYWTFGDYIGIGAGAHGKVTYEDGHIVRYAKRKQPDDYMKSATETFRATERLLEAAETPGEFVLNALRLNGGFRLEDYQSRTGLPAESLQPQLGNLVARELLTIDAGGVRTSALGRRFLDSVLAEFLPD